MSDTELTEWLAVNVMGWEHPEGSFWVLPDKRIWHIADWQPLSRIDHAWLLVEEMRRRGWHVSCLDLLADGRVVWNCWRELATGTSRATPDARAICEAIKMAKEAGDA